MISPSSLHRALACPASARDEERFPNKSNPSAERGTLLHSVLLFPASTGNEDVLEQSITESWLTEDEIALVRVAFNQIKKEINGNDATHEMPVDLSPWGVPKTGREGEHQADLAWLDKDARLHVLDFKSGKGEVETPETNPQLYAYALGLAKAWAHKADDVFLHICQPKVGNIRSARVSWSKIKAFGKKLKALTDSVYAQSGELEYKPSPSACQWCRASSTCEAKKTGSAKAKRVKTESKEKLRAETSFESKATAISIKPELSEIFILDSEAIQKAEGLLKRAQTLALPKNKAQAEAVAVLLKEVTSFEKAMDKNRLEVKRPVIELGKKVDELASQALKPLREAKALVKENLEAWTALSEEKVSGTKSTSWKKWTIIRPELVPSKYLKIDEQAISDAVQSGALQETDWLTITVEQTISSR